MQKMPTPAGVCTFPDGSSRTVYQDAAGRQFILDKDNRVVYGHWLSLSRKLARRGSDGESKGC
jgi:hypothetical protein